MMLFLADWADKKWLTKFFLVWGLIQTGFGASIYYLKTIEEAAVFLGIGILTLALALMNKKYTPKHIFYLYAATVVLNVAAVVLLGLGTGFYLQLIMLCFSLPLLLAGDKKGIVCLQFIGVLAAVLLLILDWYLLPLVSLPSFYDRVYFAVNVFTMLLMLIWITYCYEETHYEVEIEEITEIIGGGTGERERTEESAVEKPTYFDWFAEDEEEETVPLEETKKDKKDKKNKKDKFQFIPKLKWSNQAKSEGLAEQAKVVEETPVPEVRAEAKPPVEDEPKEEIVKEENLAKAPEKAEPEAKENIVLDTLTGVMNRESMLQMVDDIVAKKRQEVIVALVDIDNFKGINDVYGQEVGNVVLEKLARLMKWRLPDFYVSRWEGDAFVLMNSSLSRHEAEAQIMRFHELLKKEIFLYQQFTIKITVTIGFAWSKDPDEIEKLVEEANLLMIWGKKQGRNQVVVKSIQLDYTTAIMNKNRPDAETGQYQEKTTN